MTRSRGMSLIQVLISTALGILTVYAAVTIYHVITKSAKRTLEKSQAEQAVKQIAIFLKNRMEGSLSFQNMAFRIASSPVTLESSGPGFFVEPNTAFNATTLTGSDRLHVMAQQPLPTRVKLAGKYVPPANSMTLQAIDTTQVLSNLIKPNDLLVLSGVQYSEVIRVVSPLTDTGPGRATLSLADPSVFAPTFIAPGEPTQLRRTYSDGDYVTKARIVRIGLDQTSKELRFFESSTNRTDVIGRNVFLFQVSYSLDNSTTRCAAVQNPVSPAEPYARDRWNVLNTTGDLSCYKRIVAIKIDFQVGDDPLTQARGNYVFRANQ